MTSLSKAVCIALALSSCTVCGCGPSPASSASGPAHLAETQPPAPAISAEAHAEPQNMPTPGSFEDDLAFLTSHGPVIVLTSPTGGRVAVSAEYQGRVMTSAVAPGEASLGFIHRDFIASGRVGTQFDNYGGEDRFWLGPEGGQFGLYFPKGKPFTFDAWQTPAAFQTGAWDVVDRGDDRVVFARAMEVTNHAGTVFRARLVRTVRLLTAHDAESRLGVDVAGQGLRWVGFETKNEITNVGERAWTKKDGLPSIWILAMYKPSADTFVAIPFDPKAKGEIVNDRYFGKVPTERLAVDAEKGVVVFKCDGLHRAKIGLGPARAKATLGSYSASAGLLTVVSYDKPADARDYVNSMWEQQKDPFGGDVVNSYNDGPTEPGKASLGGFYEIETSSPGAALAPGKSLVHVHRTFHFVGAVDALDPIAKATLGVPVAAIRVASP